MRISPLVVVVIIAALVCVVGVAYLIMSGTLTPTQTVTLVNPEVDVSGFTIHEPKGYVYLVIGQDGVRLAGPEISSQVGIDLDNEGIMRVSQYGPSVYLVRVNSHLSYYVTISDFENEIGLARVELTKKGNTITSSFIFVATEDGIARNVTITAAVDEVNMGSSIPISVEARPP